MSKPLKLRTQKAIVGIIGCGYISDAYFKGAKNSSLITVKACADLHLEVAKLKAAEYGVIALTVDDLLNDSDITLVINLTVPLAHAIVSIKILQAGKHVYSEKPLSVSFKEASELMRLAQDRGLRVGCAPDTFMGASHQACRLLIDSGSIGQPIGGSVILMSHGMEGWHPNPDFFYKTGGGPALDIGPYYITQLVNLLGPVVRVAGLATIGNMHRTVTSEPLKGSVITVDVPTTVNGLLEFEMGANISLSFSWDVWRHSRVSPIEIHCTQGSLLGVNPDFFGNIPRVWHQASGEWSDLDISQHPFGEPNRELANGRKEADYRTIGLIDMAMAIQQNRPHRANGDMAMHVLEVLESLEQSSRTGQFITLQTRSARPEPVPVGHDEYVFI